MKPWIFLCLTLWTFSLLRADNEPSLREVLNNLCMLPLPSEQTMCSTRTSWYGYDAQTRRCRHFVYGCGNRRRNMFSTFLMCFRICEYNLSQR
uniref:Kunitz-type serine protease inhibitor n=1 Tax=Mimachlamys nobilis TaxID=106276 RepID=A0A7M4C2Y3_MIMNO|nr:Kunitz-type serine protease inhibitor [Mimachlamys nobilis]